MKKSLLFLFIVFALFFSCSKDKTPIIGMTMAYWEGNYSVNKTYVDAIVENGGDVQLIPATQDIEWLRNKIKELDGFVFIGGRDYPPEWYGKDLHSTMVVMDPIRSSFDSLFMALALESGKPLLGICAGEQMLNIATGGKLIRDIPNHRGVEHMIWTEDNSRIREWYGDSLIVNSWHHQCVEPAYVSDDFRVTAWSADSIVECIEYQGDTWIIGTQFHPERLLKAQRDKIIDAFLRECKK